MFRAFTSRTRLRSALDSVGAAIVACFVLLMMVGAVWVAWDYGRVSEAVPAATTAQVEPEVRYYVPGEQVIRVRATAEPLRDAAVDPAEVVRYAAPAVTEDASGS